MSVAAPRKVNAGVHLPDVEGLLREVLAEQRRQGELLEAIVKALDRGRGARDSADAALVLAIEDAIRDRTFTTPALMREAAMNDSLREAITAADITNAQELGHLCSRLEGQEIAGLVMERLDEYDRGGVVRRVVRVSNSQTRIP